MGLYGNDLFDYMKESKEEVVNESVVAGIIAVLGVLVAIPFVTIAGAIHTDNKRMEFEKENKSNIDKMKKEVGKISSIVKSEYKSDTKKYIKMVDKKTTNLQKVQKDKALFTFYIGEIDMNKVFTDALGVTRDKYVKDKGYNLYSADSMSDFYASNNKCPKEIKDILNSIKSDVSEVAKKINSNKNGYSIKLELGFGDEGESYNWAEDLGLYINITVPIKKGKVSK